MKKWTNRKVDALLRKLNLKHGVEKYMHRNQKVYAHERRTDTYIFICNEDEVDILMEVEV